MADRKSTGRVEGLLPHEFWVIEAKGQLENRLPPYLMLSAWAAVESGCTFCTNIPVLPSGSPRQAMSSPTSTPDSTKSWFKTLHSIMK